MQPPLQIADHLRSLEKKLLQPEIRKDPISVASLIGDDFVEIGQSGRTYDKAAILTFLQTEPPQPPINLTDFETRPLAENVILATYRTTRHDNTSAKRSSIWIFRDNRWQIIFHQGTPIPNP
jgi:hypothetical protein